MNVETTLCSSWYISPHTLLPDHFSNHLYDNFIFKSVSFVRTLKNFNSGTRYESIYQFCKISLSKQWKIKWRLDRDLIYAIRRLKFPMQNFGKWVGKKSEVLNGVITGLKGGEVSKSILIILLSPSLVLHFER